jgi:hypothetical protein
MALRELGSRASNRSSYSSSVLPLGAPEEPGIAAMAAGAGRVLLFSQLERGCERHAELPRGSFER